MKLAYLLTVHKNPRQVLRLINTLNHPDVTFFVNIDKKHKDIFPMKKFKYSDKKRIVLIKKSIDINWGGFTVVESILNGLREIIEYKEEFDYITLISGQDYPIKPNEYILEFLERNRGKEFLEYFKLPSKHWWFENGGLDRIHYYYNFDNPNVQWDHYKRIMKRLNVKRKIPEFIEPYGGSAWWTLTYDCIKYICDYTNRNPKFISFYKYSKFPDEMFFNTIVMNSKYSVNAVNDNLRYIAWIPGRNHPKTLTLDDYGNIATSNRLYARKFDESTDKLILNKIDDEVL